MEVGVDEALHAPEAITLFGKVVDSQNRLHAQGRDAPADLDQLRIVIMGEWAGKVEVRKLVAILDGKKVKAWLRLEGTEELIRLATRVDERVNFASLHLLECNCVIYVLQPWM